MTALFITLSTFIKFITPTIEKSEWTRLNNELKSKLTPLHFHISRSNHQEDLKVLGNQVTIIIREFLIEHKELFEDENSSAETSTSFRKHKNKTLNELEDLKKKLRKEAFGPEGNEEKKKKFYECLKAISNLRKI